MFKNPKRIFHYHLTVKDCTSNDLSNIAYSVHAKPTTIDLYNNKSSQIDRMITKYGTNQDLLMNQMYIDVKKINNLGFEIIRTKLEEVTKTLMFNDFVKYSEAHIKVSDNELKNIDGMNLSKNSSDGTKFYNARIYNASDLDTIITKIQNIPGIISEQYELVQHDSNNMHDEWWTNIS